MGYLLQNEFGAPKDTKVHPGAKVHQAIIRPFGVPTMLKIVFWCTLVHRCWCTNPTLSYGVPHTSKSLALGLPGTND